MATWEAFLLGVMVAYTPSLLFLALLLWRCPEAEQLSEQSEY